MKGDQRLVLGDGEDSAFPHVLQPYFPSTPPVKGARQTQRKQHMTDSRSTAAWDRELIHPNRTICLVHVRVPQGLTGSIKPSFPLPAPL